MRCRGLRLPELRAATSNTTSTQVLSGGSVAAFSELRLSTQEELNLARSHMGPTAGQRTLLRERHAHSLKPSSYEVLRSTSKLT
eukprot:scaffold180360_cov30-Tisochrysis_lutea.AAC.1